MIRMFIGQLIEKFSTYHHISLFIKLKERKTNDNQQKVLKHVFRSRCFTRLSIEASVSIKINFNVNTFGSEVRWMPHDIDLMIKF